MRLLWGCYWLAKKLIRFYLGSAEKHFSLIQVTDIIYDSSWSAPTEGSQSASFSSKPLKNLALWCRKWRLWNTIFGRCGNPHSTNYLISNVFFSSLLVKWKLFVLSWLFQQTLQYSTGGSITDRVYYVIYWYWLRFVFYILGVICIHLANSRLDMLRLFN